MFPSDAWALGFHNPDRCMGLMLLKTRFTGAGPGAPAFALQIAEMDIEGRHRVVSRRRTQFGEGYRPRAIFLVRVLHHWRHLAMSM